MTSQSITRRSYRWVAVPLLMFAMFSLTAGLLAAHDPRSKGYFQPLLRRPDPPQGRLRERRRCARVLPALLRHVDLREAAVAEAGLGEPGTPLVGTARVSVHVACCVPLHLQARVPGSEQRACWRTRSSAAPSTAATPRRSRSCACGAFPSRYCRSRAACCSPILIGVWYTSAVWLYTRETPTASAGATTRSGSIHEPAAAASCHTLRAAGANGRRRPESRRASADSGRRCARRSRPAGPSCPRSADELSAQQIQRGRVRTSRRSAGSP